jgi:ribosomal protein uL23
MSTENEINEVKKEANTLEKPKEEIPEALVEKPAEAMKPEIKPTEAPKPETPEKRGFLRRGEKTEKKPDSWKTLLYPHLAEKSMNMVEIDNKLVFFVHHKSTKSDIKEAVENEFNVKVRGVNVEFTRKGVKKAYVKLDPKDSAADIATRLGMI